MDKTYHLKVVLAGEDWSFLNIASPIGVQLDLLEITYLGWNFVIGLWTLAHTHRYDFMHDAYVAGSSYAIFYPDLSKFSSKRGIIRYTEWIEKVRNINPELPLLIILNTDEIDQPHSVIKEIYEVARVTQNAEVKYISFDSGQAVEDVFKPILETTINEKGLEIDRDEDIFLWMIRRVQ